ncbi:MAG TPA: Uma2 family endonuclease [Steroidobacteraceae bacterium]|nr:Uma2 family endonuclease [Steroidobacteraceae bacterium]HRX89375.1 Uma2 family endonuclease [Steroidobacteraceae bacterium]
MNVTAASQRTRIDVDQFHKMGEAGILAPGARIELIEGELLDMPPIGTRHAYGVNTLNRLLYEARVQDRGVISGQNSVIISRLTEPQPDVLVLAPRVDGHRDAVPRSDEVLHRSIR